MVLDGFFNALLGPLIRTNPQLGIVIITFVIALFTTLAYKFFSNQEELKRIKEDVKSLQKEAKEHKENKDKVMDINKRMMQRNLESMKHNLKPMIITFIPIILIFGWLNASLSFAPIQPGEQFSVSASFSDITGRVSLEEDGFTLLNEKIQDINEEQEVSWLLEAPQEEGIYSFDVEYDDVRYPKEVLVTKEQKYLSPSQNFDGQGLKSVAVSHKKLKLFFGFGWLGSYIILSI